MLDIKQLRKDPDTIEKLLQSKESDVSIKPILDLDIKRRSALSKVEELKAERNSLSAEIGKRKRNKENADDLMQKAADLAEEIKQLDINASLFSQQLQDLLAKIPNIPDSDIKVSPDPIDNVELSRSGEKRSFDFTPKNHMELNEKLHLFDFLRGAKISGAGWPVYCGLGAQLEWALINYMLQIHIKNGFKQWMMPLLVKAESMYNSGQLPKFVSQAYSLSSDESDSYLIPTAEVPLNSLHAGEILDQENLPLKYVAYTPCFRKEAGAAGKKERGLIRTHQFNKVEMFAFTSAEESQTMFDQMVASAQEVLDGLGMHYRNMLLVTGDQSFCAQRTVDIEVYLPGQERYYEVSSVSNCGSFQARRSKTRYRTKDGKTEFVHTLNGSGLATSRLMVGLLENNQQADGSVIIPPVLRPYMGGLEKIQPNT